jgi:hypothetical protein
MSTTTRTKVPMDPMRKTALIAGVAYLLTFAGSIPALPLYHDLLNDPKYILGNASDTGVLWGAIGEVICALTGIVSAVALYSVAKRYSRHSALGFVMSRTIEGAMIMVGVLSVLSIVTLKDAGTSAAGADSLVTTGRGLVALHDWTFMLGPGLMPAINALLIGSIMYKSGLVSRWIPTLGLIAGPVLFFSTMATYFGAWDQISGPAALCTLPIAIWEFSFGCHMTFKGFKPVAIPVHTNGSTAPADPAYV